ncbi:hypothetical protein AB0L85_31570 [Streptomyces sp. NPDC052051]|uniref:hypothetical protein n=1 Tax=Streptomyces sp. NPDC052051 TaxID=3154649 RepID=UPI0034479B22
MLDGAACDADGPHRTIRTWEFNVNGLDTRTAVLLLAGAGATYVAFLHPAVGVAVLVGLAVVGLLHTLMR